jgi:hypothetical protein
LPAIPQFNFPEGHAMIQRNHFFLAAAMFAIVPVVAFSEVAAVRGEGATTTSQGAPWQEVPANGVIEKPGRYSLSQDIETDRDTGITINSDDVTLDLGGHALRYTGEPKSGTFGIAASGRTGITIANGAIGGFWFNMHCTQNEKLRIRNFRFDNIPYIAINVADSKDVAITDNSFDNFRYDVPKDEKSHYVVGINIGARDTVITNNRFMAKPQIAPKDVDIETVFVLFSANVTKDCLVAKNDMRASGVMPKSYAIWVATNAQVAIVDNTIRDMLYGVTLGSDASALVCFNRFDVSDKTDAPLETIGISAAGAKDIVEMRNTFEGVATPTALPKEDGERANGG